MIANEVTSLQIKSNYLKGEARPQKTEVYIRLGGTWPLQ